MPTTLAHVKIFFTTHFEDFIFSKEGDFSGTNFCGALILKVSKISSIKNSAIHYRFYLKYDFQ